MTEDQPQAALHPRDGLPATTSATPPAPARPDNGLTFDLLATDGLRATRTPDAESRRRRNADLHAGGHVRHGQGHPAARTRRNPRADRPRQHLHLWLRPGLETVAAHGGLHRFMAGSARSSPTPAAPGFLARRTPQDHEAGVRSRRRSMATSCSCRRKCRCRFMGVLNSDIAMQFDECTPYATAGVPTSHEDAAGSMRMSMRWAQRSIDEFNRLGNPNALFGIVQGGMYEDLRESPLAGTRRHELPRARDRRPVGR